LARTEPQLLAPPVSVAPVPIRSGAPEGTGLARDVTPAAPSRPALAGIARRWDGRKALGLGLAAVLLAAVALLWTPERTADPPADEIRPAPGGAPTSGAHGDVDHESPPAGTGDGAGETVGSAGAAPGAVGGGGSEAAPGQGCEGGACAAQEQAAEQLTEEINAARASDGQAALDTDIDLARVADKHVHEMVARDRLFHTPNEVLGRRVTNWEILAESIGVGPSVSALMDAFMGSDVDRRNLLDPAFEHVGVAAVPRGQRLWVTVLFSDGNDPGTTLPPG
jgi:uncharacterized protein YkwD